MKRSTNFLIAVAIALTLSLFIPASLSLVTGFPPGRPPSNNPLARIWHGVALISESLGNDELAFFAMKRMDRHIWQRVYFEYDYDLTTEEFNDFDEDLIRQDGITMTSIIISDDRKTMKIIGKDTEARRIKEAVWLLIGKKPRS